MVQYATPHEDDVCIIILRNKNSHVPMVRYVSRTATVGDVVAMFARGAARCLIHSTIVQNASFMQPEFLDRQLDTLPYALCDDIILEVEDCNAAYRSQLHRDRANQECAMNDLNMCAVHQERIGHIHAVPVVAVPMHAAYTQHVSPIEVIDLS